MPDRVDPPNQGFRRSRWPEVTELSRIYDHGQPWCVNVAGHSDHNGDYADARRHAQGAECHSREAFLDRARRDLDGEDAGFRMYTRRRVSVDDATTSHWARHGWCSRRGHRLCRAGSAEVSLSPGEALRLACALARLVDDLTFVERAG